MKKKFATVLLLVFVSLSLFAQPKVLTTMENDGVYAQIAPGKYIEIPGYDAFTGHFGDAYSNKRWNTYPKITVIKDPGEIMIIDKVEKLILKGIDFTLDIMPQTKLSRGGYISMGGKYITTGQLEMTYSTNSVVVTQLWKSDEDVCDKRWVADKRRKVADYHFEIVPEPLERDKYYVLAVGTKKLYVFGLSK